MKKCVLIVAPFPPPYGGIASYAEKLFQGLIKKEIKVKKYNTAQYEKFRLDKSDNTRTYLRILNPNYIPLISAICFDLFRFLILLLKNKIDIIHVHTASFWAWWRSILYILIAKSLGTKTVLHIHNAIDQFYFQESGKNGRFLIRKSLTIPDHLITLSQGIKNLLTSLTPKPITAVYNGVHVESFISEKKYGKPVKILFAGFVGPLKGVPDLLKAVQKSRIAPNEMMLTVMGDGEIDEMKALAVHLGIENEVMFTGRVTEDEKIRLFKSHHILALPSYGEGQPISILEGMASGMAILSTTVGSIPEVIINGENGLLVEPGDTEALARAMVKLFDEALLKDIGKTNSFAARERYNFERVVSDNISVYKMTLER